MPLYLRPRIDVYRHLSFAAVGGFFAAYAILCRSNVMGNAQTMNLLEMLVNALYGSWTKVALHFGGFVLYVVGTMLTVFLPRLCHADMRRLSPCISAAMAVLLGFLPADMNIVLSLYPIYFAMSIQWSSFSGAAGQYSSTIFSTNNTKQASLSLATYFCDHDRAHLRRAGFYAATLLCFHIGGAMGFFSVQWFALRGAWLALLPIAWAYFMVVQEEKGERCRVVEQTVA